MTHVFSPAAWSIASLYGSKLASETRDLAGHIDAALDGARAEIERLRAERDQYLKSSVDYGNLSERLRAALLRIDSINDNPARYSSEIDSVIRKALRDEQSEK